MGAKDENTFREKEPSGFACTAAPLTAPTL